MSGSLLFPHSWRHLVRLVQRGPLPKSALTNLLTHHRADAERHGYDGDVLHRTPTQPLIQTLAEDMVHLHGMLKRCADSGRGIGVDKHIEPLPERGTHTHITIRELLKLVDRVKW